MVRLGLSIRNNKKDELALGVLPGKSREKVDVSERARSHW